MKMIYVPILKWKQGEKDALANLTNDVKEEIIPLIELSPDVIEKGGNIQVSKYWNNLFYLDTSFEVEILDSDFVNLIETCDRLENIIPVIKYDDTFSKIEILNGKTENGLALRLSIENCLEDDFNTGIQNILDLTNSINLDIILDIKDIEYSKVNEKSFVIVSILNNIVQLGNFRNIILSSSSFPNTLTGCPPGQITVIDRAEIALYNRVIKNFHTEKIVYSDYAINHWSYFEYIPGIKPSFNIRYTTLNNYLVYKGGIVQKGGLNVENVKVACEKIVAHTLYSGRDFSWGDNEIYLKATESTITSGNLTTWRAIGTNHHISLVVNQFTQSLANQLSIQF